jgi:two-component system sensor kinase FixL
MMSMTTDRDIAHQASESIIVCDAAGIIEYYNPAAEILFGWPPLTMIGQDIRRYSVGNDRAYEEWSHLLQEGTWQGVELRRSATGDSVEVDVRRHVRFDDDAIGAVIEYARPCPSNRSTAFEAHSLDRFTAASWRIDIAPARALIDSAGDGSPAVAPSDALLRCQRIVERARIIDVNDRTVRLVGGNRGRELMIGQSVAAFWPVGSRADLGELIVEASRHDDDTPARRQMASDGILRNPIFTVWRAGPDRPDEMHVAVNGAADDDRSYVYLRASEARYRKLTYYMPVALWQVDASHMGRIYADLKTQGVVDIETYLDEHPELVEFAAQSVRVTDVNRNAVQMFGGNSAQDLIRPVGYLFEASRQSLCRVMIGRFSGRENYSELMKARTLDGRILDVRLSVTYPAPLGELDTTIFSLEDITDQLSMETELRQLQADFSHAARISMLGELSSSIAHEVNQPLAAIVTNAETSLRWLAKPEPNIEKVIQLTTRVVANARRANEIVQRVRSMAEKHQPEHSVIDINAIVQESLLFLRHEIETRSIHVTTSYGQGLPPVLGDRVQLQQVLVNLLLNGAQAMENHSDRAPELAVSTGTDDAGSVCFTLKDTGPGIAEADFDRIFEGFYTTKEKGMGIGLAIVHSIVAAHGGMIAAANGKDGGARFTVTLPSAAGNMAEPEVRRVLMV